MTPHIQLRLGNMPVNLVLLLSGKVQFISAPDFATVIDQHSEVSAVFTQDNFSIGSLSNLCYNVSYNYKEIPEMLKWLQQQNLRLN